MAPQEQKRADQLNAQIKIEINSHNVNIDRTMFTKSSIEKLAIKKAKSHSKIIDKALRNECIKAIIAVPHPNFGSLKLGLM